jgi:hypothetical protein
MPQFTYTVTCSVTFDAANRKKADEIFAAEISDNLNQYIINQTVQEDS